MEREFRPGTPQERWEREGFVVVFNGQRYFEQSVASAEALALKLVERL